MLKRTEKLKDYFILRLFVVMLFILISERLVNLLISQAFFPVIGESLGIDILADNLTMLERMGILFRLLLYLAGECFYSAVMSILPPILVVARRFLDHAKIADILPISGKTGGLLLMAVTVSLILYLLPYVIGIIAYSLMVVHKVEEIREHDRAQREAYIQKRNLLLSDITHDLKTPIMTISGYAQALSEGMAETPEKQREYLGAIYAKSLQMNRLITVLFDYVKLDSDGFELKKEGVNLSEFVREVSAEMYTDIETAGLDLDVKVPQTKCFARIDRSQFARVVVNLLSNAVKHNPVKTRIGISLTEVWKDQKQNMKNSEGRIEPGREMWRIQIADTGEEIEESLTEHLFDPFVMGDASRNRAGSGLGLSIAAKIVEMHGGRLSLEQPAEAPYRKAFCIDLPKEKDWSDTLRHSARCRINSIENIWL